VVKVFVASHAPPNKRMQRRPQSEFLMVSPLPFAAPLMRGVRQRVRVPPSERRRRAGEASASSLSVAALQIHRVRFATEIEGAAWGAAACSQTQCLTSDCSGVREPSPHVIPVFHAHPLNHTVSPLILGWPIKTNGTSINY
jgi:hypothetical protein